MLIRSVNAGLALFCLGVSAVAGMSGCTSPEVAAATLGEVEPALRAPGYAILKAPPPGRGAPMDTLRIHRSFGDSLAFARVVKLFHTPGGRVLGLDQLLSYHLSTVNLADGTLQHFGRHGEGPWEFREPFSVSFRNGLSETWIYDFALNRFSVLDLSGSEPAYRKTYPGPTGVRLLDPVVGEQLVSNILSPRASLLIGAPGTREGHRLVDLGLPFDSIAHPSPVARRLLNRTFMASSPDGSKLAIAYQFTNRIDIVTIGGTLLTTILGPRAGHASYRLENGRFFWNDDNVSLYTGATASSRYIYVSVCGCRFDKEQEVRSIHVFDWNGSFVQEIAFDRPVSALAVTADDRSLFGFVEEPYPMIAEWELYRRQDHGDRGGSPVKPDTNLR